MRLKKLLAAGLLLGALVRVAPAAPVRAADSMLAAWTQIGPDGTLLARAITRGACPTADVDGREIALRLRAAPDRSFDVRSCEGQIPHGTRTVTVAGRKLPLPPAHLQTIAVLGDTGCRIEIIFFQACNDPVKWPFPAIAKLVAQHHPDLVVHTGDYYYRETACLIPGCVGSPHGDNWAVWSADFFAPAARMLAGATILAVRGNHEDCERGGLGWDRFLDVDPYGACVAHERPYATIVGGLRFFVLDSSTALDPRPSRSQAPLFRRDFAALRALAPKPTWLLTHRPMWGLAATLTGRMLPINRTLEAAEGDPKTLPVQLVVSGHIHLFEALSFADHRPPQIIVGTGGDTLSNVPTSSQGAAIDGTTVPRATLRQGFGFAIFHLAAKTIDVYDRTGGEVYVCRYGPGAVECRST